MAIKGTREFYLFFSHPQHCGEHKGSRRQFFLWDFIMCLGREDKNMDIYFLSKNKTSRSNRLDYIYRDNGYSM